MENNVQQNPDSYTAFKKAVESGHHWYEALLLSMRYWDIAVEKTARKNHVYLIDGEAFDHMLVASRILKNALKDDIAPKNEIKKFLFSGAAPIEVDGATLAKLLGEVRLKEALNFFYGVTAEEALQLAVKDEVRKEARVLGPHNEAWVTNEAFTRIYGKSFDDMINIFTSIKDLNRRHFSTEDLKQFTYFLFKHRVANSDKARTASDTKKALDKLKQMGYNGAF